MKKIEFFLSLFTILSLTACHKTTVCFDENGHSVDSPSTEQHLFVNDTVCDVPVLKCEECGYVCYSKECNPLGTNMENLTYCFSNDGYYNHAFENPGYDYDSFIDAMKNGNESSYFVKPSLLAYSNLDTPKYNAFIGDVTILNSKKYINGYFRLYDSDLKLNYQSKQKDAFIPGVDVFWNIELFYSFYCSSKSFGGSYTYVFGKNGQVMFCDIFASGTPIGSVRYFESISDNNGKFPLSWLTDYLTNNLIYLG